jgi:hypothetical protein
VNQQKVFDSSRPEGANPANTESRFACFSQRFEQQLASPRGVPALNYITLPNDHTVGTTPGERTPEAMIAENDLAVGEFVDLISHSPIWKKSLILVIEDDSQDGLDHVDAHRIPALAISAYAKRGAVVHDRYDFLSFIRTMEIVTGLRPLNLFDAVATPMYSAFDADASDNDEPYDAIVPEQDLLERNPANAANADLSDQLPLESPTAPRSASSTASCGSTSTAPTPSLRRRGRTRRASTRRASSTPTTRICWRRCEPGSARADRGRLPGR